MSTSHDHALTFDSDPLSVAAFVDRLHGECAPLQWLRELVVNSIEAISANGAGGTIFVHSVLQDMGDGDEVRKLAVTDTGEGIAEDQLYSSFQVAMTSRGRGNFGIGAKIAALPLNPAGLIYRSVIDGGEPAELMWHRTTMHGHYAACAWEDDEAREMRYVTPPSCEPEAYSRITDAGHGTQVVLCGEKPEDDTCIKLSPSPSKSTGNLHWAIRDLNFRFWRIPKDIVIRVENARQGDGEPEVKSYVVHGGEEGMKTFAVAQGAVDLDKLPYRVKWFLLDDKERNSQNGWSEGRIVGTLFRESTGVVEVYALRRMTRGAALMNDFGIYTGAERVVLLVEPTSQERLLPTTARNDLRIEGEGNISAAYKEIGQEFAGLMADRAPILAAYVKEQLEGLKSTSDEENLKEVIARAVQLYRIKNFRRVARARRKASDGEEMRDDGEILRSDDVPEPEPEPPEPDPVPRPRPQPRPRPRPRPRPVPDANGRRKAEEAPPEIAPKTFKWERLDLDIVTNYTTNTQKVVIVNTEGETYARLLALYEGRADFGDYPDVVEQVVKTKCEATLQLSIFTLEHEFESRRARLGTDFEGFFERNQGRVCLDAMASKEVDTATVRDIKNQISKAKSKEAAKARAAEAKQVA